MLIVFWIHKTQGFRSESDKLKWSSNFGFKNNLIGNSASEIPIKLKPQLCSEYVRISVYSSIFSPKLLFISITYFQGEWETVWLQLSVPTESHRDDRRLYCSPFSLVACGEISPLLGLCRLIQFVQFFTIMYYYKHQYFITQNDFGFRVFYQLVRR